MTEETEPTAVPTINIEEEDDDDPEDNDDFARGPTLTDDELFV